MFERVAYRPMDATGIGMMHAGDKLLPHWFTQRLSPASDYRCITYVTLHHSAQKHQHDL